MTVGIGAISPSKIAVAIDSLIVAQAPGGPYSKHLFQQKAFHLPSESGGVLLAYSGYRKFGRLKSLYEEGLSALGSSSTFNAIVEMFSSFVAPMLTNESIRDHQPQPAEFIVGAWWLGDGPRLAVVSANDVSWPELFRTVAIGGSHIWAARTELEGLAVPEKGALERRLLARLSRYITESPASNYDFPLCWVTLTKPERWNWGFVDSAIKPISAPV